MDSATAGRARRSARKRPDELAGDVLGIGGRTAIAAQVQRAAGPERLHDHLRDAATIVSTAEASKVASIRR